MKIKIVKSHQLLSLHDVSGSLIMAMSFEEIWECVGQEVWRQAGRDKHAQIVNEARRRRLSV